MLDPEKPDQVLQVGASLPPDLKTNVIQFLKENSDYFTWSYEDIVGIDPKVITHKLNVDPAMKLV